MSIRADHSAAPPANLVWIDNLRILAVAAVVLLHVSGHVFRTFEDGFTSGWWAGNLYNSFSRWCVPALVMVSGGLLLNRPMQASWWAFYKRRASRIVLPLIFWCGFFLAYDVLILRAPITGSEALESVFWFGNSRPHLWFLYMLAGLYVLTPVLRLLHERLQRMQMFALCFLLFAVSIELPEFLRPELFGSSLLVVQASPPIAGKFFPFLSYFVLGGLLFSAPPFLRRTSLLFWALTGLLISGATAALIHHYGMSGPVRYFHQYLSPGVIIMSVTFFLWCRGHVRPLAGGSNGTVARATLGIYLIHPLFISLLWRYAGFNVEITHPLVSIPLVTLTVFSLSLLLSLLLLKLPLARRLI